MKLVTDSPDSYDSVPSVIKLEKSKEK